jgi:hypothetical protein
LLAVLLRGGAAQGWRPSPELWRWAALAAGDCGGVDWLAFLDGLRDDLGLDLPAAAELAGRGREALPGDREAQLATFETLRRLGAAAANWLQDEVAAAAGPPRFLAEDYALLSRERAAELLAPYLGAAVPFEDGWGHPLELRFNLDDPLASRVILLRSPGRDGQFEGAYEYGFFPWRDYDRDLVWADGRFVRWPAPF